MLEGGRGSEWLSVEVDEGQLKLTWWISRPDLHLDPTPQLTVGDTDCPPVESGRTEFRTEDEVGPRPGAKCGTTTWRRPGGGVAGPGHIRLERTYRRQEDPWNMMCWCG